MDDETRAAFGRIEHWFELNQLQFVEMRRDLGGRIDRLNDGVDILTGRVDILTGRVDTLTDRFEGLSAEFHSFRDWATVQVAEVRSEQRRDDLPL
ncbi:hypothetical protein BH23GEM9_BH23GEM9_03370 [soil metagenome]